MHQRIQREGALQNNQPLISYHCSYADSKKICPTGCFIACPLKQSYKISNTINATSFSAFITDYFSPFTSLHACPETAFSQLFNLALTVIFQNKPSYHIKFLLAICLLLCVHMITIIPQFSSYFKELSKIVATGRFLPKYIISKVSQPVYNS